MDFKNKNILITGASRGLGKELAHTFARAGARLAIVGRNIETISATANELKQQGYDVTAIEGDTGSKYDAYRITGLAFEALGSIDILINNAATLGTESLQLLLDTDCEQIEAALQTNLIGPFRLTKAVAGSMLFAGGGTVINITSDASIVPYPEWGAYSVSKAALDHLTKILAVESATAAIKFILLDPGEMDTSLHAQALPLADPNTLSQPAAVAAALVEHLQNFGNPESIQRLGYNSSTNRMEVLI